MFKYWCINSLGLHGARSGSIWGILGWWEWGHCQALCLSLPLDNGGAKTQLSPLHNLFPLHFLLWSLGSTAWNTLILQAGLFRTQQQILSSPSFCRELRLCITVLLFLSIYPHILAQLDCLKFLCAALWRACEQVGYYLLSFNCSASRGQIRGDPSLHSTSDITVTYHSFVYFLWRNIYLNSLYIFNWVIWHFVVELYGFFIHSGY